MALIKLNTRSIPDNAVTPAKVSQNLGRRNMTINGAMQVSQRATSVTGITSGNNLTADRFSFYTGTNGGTYTLSTTTDVPSGEGFEKSLKIDCTTVGNYSTAGTNTMLRCSPFEIQDCARLSYGTSGAKKLTVSFWTRASYAGTFSVLLVTHDTAQRSIIKTFTIASVNTWQKVILTYDGDTGSTFTGSDVALGLSLDIWMGGGSNFTGGTQTDGVWRARSTQNTSILEGNGTLFGTSTSHDFYITGVQVETGDTATDFEHRSFSEELASCKRYFQKSGNYDQYMTNGSSTTTFGTGAKAWAPCVEWGGSVAGHATHILSVEMRSTPSMTKYGNSQGYWGYIASGGSAPTSDNTLAFHQHLYIGADGTGVLGVNNQATGSTIWGAMGGWTADAEL